MSRAQRTRKLLHVGVGSAVVPITACMHVDVALQTFECMFARLMVMARKASFNFCLRHREWQYDAGREGSHLISSHLISKGVCHSQG